MYTRRLDIRYEVPSHMPKAMPTRGTTIHMALAQATSRVMRMPAKSVEANSTAGA